MREIKFRAWHKDLDKMYFDVEVSSTDWLDKTRHFGGDKSTLMQFTGLKDKNGKEIYEGDILISHFGRSIGRGQVWEKMISLCVFDEDEAKFIFETKIRKRIDAKEINNEYLGDSPIIGNKFENPELLK